MLTMFTLNVKYISIRLLYISCKVCKRSKGSTYYKFQEVTT